MPVGKPSAVEHDELAGESACPTYSAWTGGKSQENVETPGKPATRRDPFSRRVDLAVLSLIQRRPSGAIMAQIVHGPAILDDEERYPFGIVLCKEYPYPENQGEGFYEPEDPVKDLFV